MYFKQLEMTGFKSFADRTMLRLEPGMTAIVGPNGCGKSNILDAMRWVLGEQRSKELRGSHMQDVIFNGSEKRHAMGMAEVSVTFDNADSSLPVDFAEVQVTRRLYRSGESEYLVNKALCRLRDIQELFMDTGIGTQAYSMIGQGKMDLILSQKPEDRRFLFEEAAGIIKYKNRKRLAIRRLESAEQNLLRLADIITEIERQMRSLKRQVNAVIRYRELEALLRELEIRSDWLRFSRLTEAIARLRGEFATAQDAYTKVSTDVTRLEARHEELDLARIEVDRELLDRRERVHAIDTEMERLEKQIALVRQQIDFARKGEEDANSESDALRQRVEEVEAQMAESARRAGEVRAEAAACLAEIDAKTRENAEVSAGVSAAEGRVEEMRVRATERVNMRARTQSELESLDARIQGIRDQLAEIDARQASDADRRAEMERRLAEARAGESAKNDTLAKLEETRQLLREDEAAKSQRLRELNEEWQRLRERKSSLDARLNSLRELRDNYEGFAVGVRAVMRAKSEGMSDMAGLIGPAGDLLSTEKTYERAIEAALGGNINNVVTEEADDAKAAIAFLRKHNAGRVTFLPLDIVRGGEGDTGDAIRNRKGFIGPAISYVKHDPHIRPAVEQLLHSTVIIETLDDAIAIARSENRHPRMVTLEGEVVTQSGAVTGGRTKNESRGLLGRSAEITELEDGVRTTGHEIAALADQGQELTESLRELASGIKETDRLHGETSRELGQMGVVIARQSTELENLGQGMETLAAQRADLERRIGECETQRAETAARAEELENDDEALQQELAAAREEAAAARADLAARAEELGTMRIRHAGLSQRAEELERDRAREERERDETIRAIERRREMLLHARDRQGELEEAVKVHIDESRALAETKGQAQEQVVQSSNRQETILNEIEALDTELRALRDQSNALQKQVHQLELDLRTSEEKAGFCQERILERYQITLASLSAEEVGTDDHDEDERDAIVADTRERLQKMGDVNLGAIEEYEAHEQRHQFLSGQMSDLQDAKERLLGVIARSDKRIREMFMETFDQVANHFREFFRILFNGGQARVYLINEDDPLESGIEIEARPPGKKPTSISLLSGGESNLTAIALLFSILKAKPTPFCVLDEVDAPLDDVNIGRFLKMLDEFMNQTQFVVITHNKNTMAKADAMYGITMQERGVSTIISAKLSSADDPAA